MNETITYAPIWTEKRWTGDGWGSNPRLLKQLKREGDVVLIEVKVEKTGLLAGYEVAKIGRHEAYEIAGNMVPAAESYPGCAFGKGNKNVAYPSTLERAEEIFANMVARQDERDEENAEAELTGSVIERRGRPRKDKSSATLQIPDIQFSHEDFAILNNMSKPNSYLPLRALVDAGTIVATGTRPSGRGKPTNLFQKA